jgi:hypothetical protein
MSAPDVRGRIPRPGPTVPLGGAEGTRRPRLRARVALRRAPWRRCGRGRRSGEPPSAIAPRPRGGRGARYSPSRSGLLRSGSRPRRRPRRSRGRARARAAASRAPPDVLLELVTSTRGCAAAGAASRRGRPSAARTRSRRCGRRRRRRRPSPDARSPRAALPACSAIQMPRNQIAGISRKKMIPKKISRQHARARQQHEVRAEHAGDRAARADVRDARVLRAPRSERDERLQRRSPRRRRRGTRRGSGRGRARPRRCCRRSRGRACCRGCAPSSRA